MSEMLKFIVAHDIIVAWDHNQVSFFDAQGNFVTAMCEVEQLLTKLQDAKKRYENGERIRR